MNNLELTKNNKLLNTFKRLEKLAKLVLIGQTNREITDSNVWFMSFGQSVE